MAPDEGTTASLKGGAALGKTGVETVGRLGLG